jgi:hypothetical protein
MRRLHSSTLLVALLTLGSCCDDDCHDDCDHHDDVPPPDTGVVASDFQSLAHYFDSPVVQRVLENMPRYGGSTPPDVSGVYLASGTVTVAAMPGAIQGDPVVSRFCFGTPAGSLIEVTVQDPSVVDAGAASFIEGTGDSFTVYTAFKSVQTLESGTTCEFHEVNIFSGRRNVDGSLSDLYIGQGIVGLIGTCSSFLPGDFTVSHNIADRVADSCGTPGGGPGNPENVLVTVENQLISDVLVFTSGTAAPVVQVAPLSSEAFETSPGFVLLFETLQPIAGQDGEGNDLLMGEIVAGQFPQDVTVAGGTVTYSLENQVGSDIFFAPLPVNRVPNDIFSVVNIGVDVPGYPTPAGSGLDCLCSMAPSVDSYVIGYYSYSAPGIIVPTQANAHFFLVADPSQEVAAFTGPFTLDLLSGTVTLVVD